MRRVIGVTVVIVLATACAGPKPKIDYGGKSVPISVAFGKPKAATTPPLVLRPGPGGIGVVPFVPGLGGFAPRPAGTPAPVAPTPTTQPQRPVSCPEQDPFKFPRREATNVVADAVPEGTFPYRIKGSFTVNGTKTPYTSTVVTTVKRLPSDATDRRRFQLSFSLLEVSYTVTYSVRPPVEAVPGEIGLASVVRDDPDELGATFLPDEPLRLLQLRAERGITWTDTGTDPGSQSTATVNGLIADKARVNACGQPVEAWKSVVTQRTVTPDQDVTATRTLFFATGYGGLLVGETVSFTGTAGGDKVSGESSSTINVDPAAP